MKLALGTVQFGLDYGISNNQGIVPEQEVKRILDVAHKAGIRLLDTGCAYGNSEQILGKLLSADSYQFSIVDKVPDIESYHLSVAEVVLQSIEKLKVDKLKGLMLHNAADLNDQTFQELEALKSQGLVDKIGISVYYPSQTFELCGRYDIDLVQCPLNLFDQRFVETDCINFLKDKSIEVHARSLFLQGLLLMPRGKLPKYFAPYHDLFDRLHGHCRGHNIDLQTAALTIAHQQQTVDQFVIGVCNAEQLQQVVDSYNNAAKVKFEIADFSSHEEALISPFLWPQKT